MDRKFVIALSSLAGSMMLTEAHAIGLGEIRLHTALNEPLRADIQLVQVKDLSEGEIIVNLAPKADFDRAGVDRDFLLNSLRFRLDLDDPKHPKIVVTTQQPIREPFLDFLVEVQWPTGRLLREYTLLMDLPAFAESSAVGGRGVTGTKVSSGQPQPDTEGVSEVGKPAARSPRSTAPASSSDDGIRVRRATNDEISGTESGSAREVSGKKFAGEARSQSRETTAAADSVTGQYGPTRSSDTLWKIAQRVRNGGNVHQNMVAIQRLNPAAFANNNINMLKKGQVLKLPSHEEIASISRAEAAATVNEQNVAWKTGRTGKTEGAPLDATNKASASSATATQTDGQLKIAAPGAVGEGQTGQGQAGEAGQPADTTALKNQLDASQEELNRVQREKEEAAAKASALNGQVENQQRLLELQNSEMANMQAKLTAEQQAKAAASGAESAPAEGNAVAPEGAGTAAPAATGPESGAESVGTTEPVATEAPAEPPAAEVAQPPVAAPAPEAAPAPAVEPASAPVAAVEPAGEKGGGLSSLFSGIAVVVAVLLGLFGYRRMANRAGEQAEKAIDVGIDYVPVPVEAPPIAESLEADTAFEVAAPQAEVVSAPATVAVEPPKPETGDVLGEADIYISFGNFEKGEALLKSAIGGEPGRSDYRLKLLELYKESGDLAAFDHTYEALLDLHDDAANAKAADMRTRIPGADAAPFAAAATAAMVADEGFDLDLGLDTTPAEMPAAAEIPAEPVAEPVEEFDLGFDLDLDVSTAPLQVEEPAPAAVVESEPLVMTEDTHAAPAPEVDDLDLDFNLDVDAAPVAAVAEEPVVQGGFAAAEESLLADDELGFMSDADEAATKLDLARAYIDMGDKDGARDILAEVLEEGQDEQKREAQALLDSIG